MTAMSPTLGAAVKVTPPHAGGQQAPHDGRGNGGQSQAEEDAQHPAHGGVVPASMTNWLRMSLCLAPRDLRMPISRVRSVTDTSMMFMDAECRPPAG